MVKALASYSLLATLIGAFLETARPGRPTNIKDTSTIILRSEDDCGRHKLIHYYTRPQPRYASTAPHSPPSLR